MQITCNTSSAYHVQVSCYEGTAQLLSLIELKSHLFELYFIGWTIKPMKEGRKPEYPEKTTGNAFNIAAPHTSIGEAVSYCLLGKVMQKEIQLKACLPLLHSAAHFDKSLTIQHRYHRDCATL